MSILFYRITINLFSILWILGELKKRILVAFISNTLCSKNTLGFGYWKNNAYSIPTFYQFIPKN
jgi:hypothetical protein